MRIIAGQYRGRKLQAPKGEGTRPTTDRVRESMMSVLYSARDGFEGARVLDAFAGSGALGLETLSRGAESACFYDQDAAALRALQANIRAMGLSPQQAQVRRGDVLANPPVRMRPAFDLVLLDPPYAYAAADVLGMVCALRAGGALAPSALVVYEHDAADCAAVDEAVQDADLSLAQRKKYGDTVVDTLRLADAGTQA